MDFEQLFDHVNVGNDRVLELLEFVDDVENEPEFFDEEVLNQVRKKDNIGQQPIQKTHLVSDEQQEEARLRQQFRRRRAEEIAQSLIMDL